MNYRSGLLMFVKFVIISLVYLTEILKMPVCDVTTVGHYKFHVQGGPKTVPLRMTVYIFKTP